MHTKPLFTGFLAILMFALSLCALNGCSGSSADTDQDEEEFSDSDDSEDGGSGDKGGKKGDSKKSGKKEITVEVSKGTFMDPRDGKTYPTLTIGGQTWMAKDLDFSKGLDSVIKRPEGTAYLWKDAQNACPDGWHLPSNAEWNDLFASVKKDFKDSVAWALKSKSGWDSTWANVNGEYEDVSGNGADIYGFNIQAAGTGFGDDLFERTQGEEASYWTTSRAEDKRYNIAIYITHDRTFTSTAEANLEYSSLFIRCVSDSNSTLTTFGECDDSRKDEINKLNGVYYYCSEAMDWSRAETQQILNHEYGECNEDNSNIGHYNDTAFVCKCERECRWKYGTSREGLPECDGSKKITNYLDSTFVCGSGAWHPAKPEEIYSECTEENSGQIVSLNKQKYVCHEPAWRVMTLPDSAVGICNASRSWTVYTRKVEPEYSKTYYYDSYACEYEHWRRFTSLEDTLGYCETDGKTGVAEGYTFECDASKHRWFTTITDERDGNKYRAVIAHYHLWMAEDLRYGGKDRYTWSEALGVPPENDTEFWTKISDPDSAGICPEGWHIPTMEQWEDLISSAELMEDIGILFEVGNPETIQARDFYGLSLSLDQIDTVKSTIRTEMDNVCVSGLKQSGEYGTIIEEVCSRQVGGEPMYYIHSGSYWSIYDIVALRGLSAYDHNVAIFSEYITIPDGQTQRGLGGGVIDGERTTPRALRCIKPGAVGPLKPIYLVEEE